ncbi:hypothetical protein [Sphingomonas endophytica]|uniref:STAS/SEC14 domain-containing protein n=1 Tax=Sphingomonas endophytica TaxID=869719 RepID=A0A147HWX0_9SPHN|nr:hypothetical protein [Sphingomonas endophytica]KTT69403.1 hypothetical protein NS334_14690 [Sphingomonas endophytica]
MYLTDRAPARPRITLPPGNGMTTTYDRAGNFLRVTCRGFWPMDYAVAHLSDFEVVLHQARRMSRPSRTLVDLREAGVLDPAVADYTHATITAMYRPPERAAILVASTLARLQMRRGLNPATHAVFTTLDEAMRWLDGPIA